MSGSKVKVTGTKKALSSATPPGAYEWYALAANSEQQQQTGHFLAARGCFRLSSASSTPVGKSSHAV